MFGNLPRQERPDKPVGVGVLAPNRRDGGAPALVHGISKHGLNGNEAAVTRTVKNQELTLTKRIVRCRYWLPIDGDWHLRRETDEMAFAF